MNILRLARYVTVTVVAAAGLWLPAAPVSATPPHVVFIMMENTGKWGIIGTDANRARSPYQAGLWTNPAVWHFTNYFGITHPSLPNYLGFASGSTAETTGSDSVYAGKFTGPSLWSQLSAPRAPGGGQLRAQRRAGALSSKHRVGPGGALRGPGRETEIVGQGRVGDTEIVREMPDGGVGPQARRCGLSC